MPHSIDRYSYKKLVFENRKNVNVSVITARKHSHPSLYKRYLNRIFLN